MLSQIENINLRRVLIILSLPFLIPMTALILICHWFTEFQILTIRLITASIKLLIAFGVFFRGVLISAPRKTFLAFKSFIESVFYCWNYKSPESQVDEYIYGQGRKGEF